MEEKNKGLPFWRNFDPELKGMIIAVFVIVLIITLLSARILTLIRYESMLRETAACSEFAGWTADAVPVRCLAYFGLRVKGY